MSIASDNLVTLYTTELQQYIERATELQVLIDSSKKSTRRNYYKRKLTKNNKKFAHVAIKLEKLMQIKEGGDK